jgi:hypothetical protein
MGENPWQRLPEKAPFVLPEDKEEVEAFNLKPGQRHPLYLGLIPEPFIGRQAAPLVLLGNTSGVSEATDEPAQPAPFRLKPAFMERMRNNLLNNKAHTESAYPFLYFDPEINPPGDDGGDWWDRKLKCVLAEFRIGNAAKPLLAKNILAVEYFPYVCCSSRYHHDRLRLPSQYFSFDLVRDAMKHNAVIVIRHGDRRWREKVPELNGYPRLVRLQNYQKGLMSPNNCHDNGWSHIREVVRTLESKD